jgi:phospholipid/cholesterol/gamma-HCH transport system substrate-binding protein
MSQTRNVQTSLAAIKLGIFVLVSLIVTGTLTAIMGSFAFGGQHEYKAEFTSASLI